MLKLVDTNSERSRTVSVILASENKMLNQFRAVLSHNLCGISIVESTVTDCCESRTILVFLCEQKEKNKLFRTKQFT